MTEDLYRKEALEHRHRSLYGEVVLRSPPATWMITFILLSVMVCFIGLLFFGKVQTDEAPLTVWQWLLSRTQ